tara:strand:- start:3107 stop:4027 length:921 start_codon:yes stop_codon:yes gene_type:complete
MLYFLKKQLKKNYYIYLISLFLYQKILISFYQKLIICIKFLSNYNRNKIFKSHPKEFAKIIIYKKEFFYPKYSTHYEKFLKTFEVKTKLNSDYNLIAKNFIEKEIDCILDVGACIGYQSLFYNEFFGNKVTIHCFEPHPINFYFLKKNLSSFDNIKLHNFALGNENKEDNMSIPLNKSHILSNLGTLSIGQKSNIFKNKIQIKKFDLLSNSFLQFKKIYIKIDVEGYEDNVLNGMYNYLNNNPHIYLKIEINKDFNSLTKIKSTINFLEKMNYKFFLLKSDEFVKHDKLQIMKSLIYKNEELFCKK